MRQIVETLVRRTMCIVDDQPGTFANCPELPLPVVKDQPREFVAERNGVKYRTVVRGRADNVFAFVGERTALLSDAGDSHNPNDHGKRDLSSDDAGRTADRDL